MNVKWAKESETSHIGRTPLVTIRVHQLDSGAWRASVTAANFGKEKEFDRLNRAKKWGELTYYSLLLQIAEE